MNPNGRSCPVIAHYHLPGDGRRSFGELLGINCGRAWRKIQPPDFRRELRRAWQRLGPELVNMVRLYRGVRGAAVSPALPTIDAWLERLHVDELARLEQRQRKENEHAA